MYWIYWHGSCGDSPTVIVILDSVDSKFITKNTHAADIIFFKFSNIVKNVYLKVFVHLRFEVGVCYLHSSNIVQSSRMYGDVISEEEDRFYLQLMTLVDSSNTSVSKLKYIACLNSVQNDRDRMEIDPGLVPGFVDVYRK